MIPEEVAAIIEILNEQMKVEEFTYDWFHQTAWKIYNELKLCNCP